MEFGELFTDSCGFHFDFHLVKIKVKVILIKSIPFQLRDGLVEGVSLIGDVFLVVVRHDFVLGF